MATFRTARSSDYPDIASILNVPGDDDHQVDATRLERLDERWRRYGTAFRRVVR